MDKQLKLAYQREYREKEPQRYKDYAREWSKRNPFRQIENAKKRRLKVLQHYSGGKPFCKCCGEDDYAFLTIDHVKNDGHLEKKNGKRITGGWLICKILRENYPESYQVLCFNCNCAKGSYGECPHRN